MIIIRLKQKEIRNQKNHTSTKSTTCSQQQSCTEACKLNNNLKWYIDILDDVLSSLYNYDMNKQQESKCSLWSLLHIIFIFQILLVSRVVQWSANLPSIPLVCNVWCEFESDSKRILKIEYYFNFQITHQIELCASN